MTQDEPPGHYVSFDDSVSPFPPVDGRPADRGHMLAASGRLGSVLTHLSASPSPRRHPDASTGSETTAAATVAAPAPAPAAAAAPFVDRQHFESHGFVVVKNMLTEEDLTKVERDYVSPSVPPAHPK